VVAATHRELERLVKEGKFRADLFYRVAVVRVAVPPLRDRPEDVPLLIDRFVAALGPHKHVAPEVYALLSDYDWPGNARELRNVIERAIAVAEGRVIDARAIFPDADEAAPAQTFHAAKENVVAAFEKRYVEALLQKHEGNVSRAAKEAGLSRNALYALMKRVGISEPSP
jgi:DNA-binding NtrC family response regulator